MAKKSIQWKELAKRGLLVLLGLVVFASFVPEGAMPVYAQGGAGSSESAGTGEGAAGTSGNTGAETGGQSGTQSTGTDTTGTSAASQSSAGDAASSGAEATSGSGANGAGSETGSSAGAAGAEGTGTGVSGAASQAAAAPQAPAGVQALQGTQNVGPLATFDGNDLSGDADKVTFSYTDFMNSPKVLEVAAAFSASDDVAITGRTITIRIQNGLKFATLPGFYSSGGTWVYRNSDLPAELRSAVETASFVQDAPITVSNRPNSLGVGSGTVTYVLKDSENVTEFVLRPTVAYDTLFWTSSQDEKLYTNAITVTTKETRDATPTVIETQVLETLAITGKLGLDLNPSQPYNLTLIRGQAASFDFCLLSYGTGATLFGGIYDTLKFTIHVPKGFIVAGTPITYPASSGLSTANVAYTVVNNADGSTSINITMTNVYAGGTDREKFTLNFTVGETAAYQKHSFTGSNFSLKPYGDYPEGAYGRLIANPTVTVFNLDNLTETVTITKSPSMYGIGYVPESEMDPGTSTVLGAYCIRNINPFPTDLQSIHIDFADNGACARTVRIPVGSDGVVPHLRAVLASGKVITAEDYAVGFARSMTDGTMDYIVFDLREFTAAPNSVSATDYIVSIEYEIDKLVGAYGGATNGGDNNIGGPAFVFGYFHDQPANFIMDVSVNVGSLEDVGTGWNAPVNITIPILEKTNIGISMSTPMGDMTAGSTYTRQTRLALVSIPTNTAPGAGIVTYVKGLDVYIRSMGISVIDADSIYVEQQGVTPSVYEKVPAERITELVDNTGNIVYKVRLPDIIMSYKGAVGRADHAFNLKYTFKVNANAPTQVRSMVEPLWVQPIQKDHSPAMVKYAGYGININANQYDVAGDGNTTQMYGTGSSSASFTVQGQKIFYVSTAAKLQLAGGYDSGWVTYNGNASSVLGLTPIGTSFYQLQAENLSGAAVGSYTAHIPVPHVPGSGAGEASFGGTAFTWSAAIKNKVISSDASGTVITYSTQYVANTADANIATLFQTWEELAAAGLTDEIRTIRIERTSPIPDGAAPTYTFEMKVLGDIVDKAAWSGNINNYSAVVSYTLSGSITKANVASEPVAIRLDSGLVVGRVYKDANRNGQYDAGEELFENVRVTSTRATGGAALPDVYTDENGIFMVPTAEGDAVKLVIQNPQATPDGLRFPGSIAAAATSYTIASATAVVDETVQAGLDFGMIPPYAVQFNDNCANPASFETAYKYPGSTLAAGDIPTATTVPGYTFARWYSKADDAAGGIAADAYLAPDLVPGSENTAGDITFYAIRTGKTVDIIYDLAYEQSEGVSGSNILLPANTAAKTATYGAVITEAPNNVPSRQGLVFLGWKQADTAITWAFSTGGTAVTTTNGVVGADSATPTLTLTAQWGPANVTVLFDTQGGTPVPAEQTLLPGALVTKPATDPSLTGKDFKGWYTAAINGNVWDFATDTTPAGGTTLYAQYLPIAYKLTFDYNGAGKNSVSNLYYQDPIVKPADPTRTGYAFGGWFDEQNAEWNFTTGTMPARDLTLKAKWTLKNYTVTYMSEGAVLDTKTVAYGALVPSFVPTRTGYTFQHWTLLASGNQVWDFAKNTMPNNDITLVAVWQEIPASVPVSSSAASSSSTTSRSVSSGSSGSSSMASVPVVTSTESVPPAPTSAASAPQPTSGVILSPTLSEAFSNQSGNPITDIFNGRVPTGGLDVVSAWSFVSLLLGVLGFFLSVLLLVTGLVKKRRGDGEQDSRYAQETVSDAAVSTGDDTTHTGAQPRRPLVLWLLSIFAGLLPGALFLLLDDISQPMVWFNRWTLLIALVFVGFAALTSIYLAVKNRQRTTAVKDAEEMR